MENIIICMQMFVKGCNFMAFLGSDQCCKDWLEIEILNPKSQFLYAKKSWCSKQMEKDEYKLSLFIQLLFYFFY